MVNRNRLFLGSCLGLIATSVGFAAVGDVLDALKNQFLLSNEQVGYIGGARIWGFTISIFVLGPLCDLIGMRTILRLAILCHAAGTLTMIFAQNFWMLFAGALVLAMGNGSIEAACNPLVATLFPDQKTKKLNQFHVWFPGGMVLGGLASFGLSELLRTHPGILGSYSLWQVQIALILIPTVLYAITLSGQQFPATERVQSGVTFGGMVQGAFGRPLFWILMICMVVTASLELGPNNWIPAVLKSGGMHGILVLAYISGLMAVLRFFAGPLVHRLSPTGILMASAVLAGIGLYWFSFAETVSMALASATVFAVGVCYFWPTMLGVTSERVPRSGSLGLALMGGMGMLAVGVLTAPQMGAVADKYLLERLNEKPQETVTVLQKVVATYMPASANEPEQFRAEIAYASGDAQTVLTAYEAKKTLPANTADALRSAAKNHPHSDDMKPIVDQINATLNPADNYGGRMSFRYVAPFSLLIIVVFGALYLRDKAAGGYKAESLQNVNAS